MVLIYGGAGSEAIRIYGTLSIPQVTGQPYAYLAGGSARVDVTLHIEDGEVVIDSQVFTATATASPWGSTPSSTGTGSGNISADIIKQ